MRRRDILGKGGAAMLACALPAAATAQTKTGDKRRPIISSSNLQWLRSPQDLVQATVEMGFAGVALSVGPAPAHVLLGDGDALRSYAGTLRDAGLAMDTIQLLASPGGDGFDSFLRSCRTLGIRQFVFGPLPYAVDRPLADQTALYSKQLAALAGACARQGVRALYRNRAGLYLGAALWDAAALLRDLDPEGIGLCYDAGQGVLSGGQESWVVAVKDAGKQIGCVVCTDTTLHLRLDAEEGGAFHGTPDDLVGNKTPRPLGGGGGQTNPWTAPCVPLGTGLVDLPRLGTVLKEIGFAGPLIIQSDYPNGGAENGGDKLTLPPAMVLGAMKRDRLTLKTGFSASGLI